MGSLERFLIVCHVLRLVCVRSVDVMTSSHLFFSSSVTVNQHLWLCCQMDGLNNGFLFAS